jgi:hypothetical protein
MRPTRVACVAAVTVAAVLAFNQKPYAYVAYGWSWQGGQAPYYVNPTNMDVSPDAALAAIQSAAAAWTTQTQSPFGFYYMGTTTGNTVANNGRNEVFFRSDSNGSAIATTYYWVSGTQALDADIVFWDGGFKFFTGASGCSGGFYIEDVATHEFGHALGLGHSPVTDATMVSGTGYCATWKRSLASDDIAGIDAVYPISASTLTASATKVKNVEKVALAWTSPTWSATTGTSVYRNGSVIAALGSVMIYTDSVYAKAGIPYTYKVCSTGTTTCSNSVTLTF